MLYIQAIKSLYKVKDKLYKQKNFKDYKTMSELINAIETKITKLEKKLSKKIQKQQ